MTIALRMRRKFNEFSMTNFLELASPLIPIGLSEHGLRKKRADNGCDVLNVSK